MKYTFFLVVFFLLYVNVVLGQTVNNTEAKDSTNIYYQAFRYYCQQLPSNNNVLLLVEENNITTESLPKELSGFKIDLLDIGALQKKLKNTKSLILIRIVPLRLERGSFFVNIIPFAVRRSKSGINYINGGGSRIAFLYDCTTDTFTLESVNNSGI